MMLHKWVLFNFVPYLLFLCLNLQSCIAQDKRIKVFNIKEYGAVGDGTNDDYSAIQKCFSDAGAVKYSRIVVPYGTYRLSKFIDVQCFFNLSLVVEGEMKNGKMPLFYLGSLQSAILRFRGYSYNQSQGLIKVQNLGLESYNPPFSDKHPYVNKQNYMVGLYIADKRNADVINVNVKNVYGQGIQIINTLMENVPDKARFKSVAIKNCTISNTWGLNPSTDSFGDGIYLSGVSSALIEGNKIENKLSLTKQLGRCGIVIEYNAQNCAVKKNKISGYDRLIHIEADYGGHVISQNELSGSDVGVLVSVTNLIPRSDVPVDISDNILSNLNYIKTPLIKTVREPRGLVMFDESDNRKGSIVRSNKLKVYKSFDFDKAYNYIFLNKAKGIVVRKNLFENQKKDQSPKASNVKKALNSGNTLVNVKNEL